MKTLPLAATLVLAILAEVDEAIARVYTIPAQYSDIVQANGYHAIEAFGASRGALANGGGLGAKALDDAVLSRGESVTVYVVGQGGEPSTWETVLLGFIGLGCAGYRRANKHRPAGDWRLRPLAGLPTHRRDSPIPISVD
jgi:hypothetical protein